jgi:DNA mismatch repair protein MutL
MINGRFIKNYSLLKAIQEGYHTLLPIGRYPIALLKIDMDPILVDVNVHPSKLEVRISKEQELNVLISETIKSAFREKVLIPDMGWKKEKGPIVQTEQTALELDHVHKPSNGVERQQSLVEPNWPNRKSLEATEAYTTNTQEETVYDENNANDLFVRTNELEQQSNTSDRMVSPRVSHEDFKGIEDEWKSTSITNTKSSTLGMDDCIFKDKKIERVPPLYPIGQMHGTYIFAQNEKGLYIIDQHAAQERIKYEFYKEKVGQVASELQELLVPLTFEYSTDDFVKVNENKEELEKVGVFLEPFGYNSFIVRAHPQWLPKGEEKEVIEEMIEQLLSMKKVDIKKLREEAAIMMSCKGSIKANRHLRNDEIQALLDELRFTSDPFTCPHGRPIIIHTSIYELEKMFKRIM